MIQPLGRELFIGLLGFRYLGDDAEQEIGVVDSATHVVHGPHLGI